MQTEDTVTDSIVATMAYFERILSERLQAFYAGSAFDEACFNTDFLQAFPLSPVASLKRHYDLTEMEFILFLTALLPHLDAYTVDRHVERWLHGRSGDCAEIGGIRNARHRGFVPTVQTFVFLVAGNDFAKKLQLRNFFHSTSPILRKKLVLVEKPGEGDPFTSAVISVPDEHVNSFFGTKEPIPDYSSSFPAKMLHTRLDWESLVLNDTTRNGIADLKDWFMNNYALLHTTGAAADEQHGYKILFYGPPGTGKTLAAALIGRQFNTPVFRIDISLLVANDYAAAIGIIDNIFRLAEQNSWILLIDQIMHVKDKYTAGIYGSAKLFNDPVTYLLQRTEDYPGIVIFETTSIQRMDDNFLRKLQSTVEFLFPNGVERKRLWMQGIPTDFSLDKEVDLSETGENYHLSGADITKIIKRISLKVHSRNDRCIKQADIMDAISAQFKFADKNDIRIFVSYSSKDRKMRDLLVDGIKEHLAVKTDIQYSVWDDRQINMGANWQQDIDKALQTCRVAILLVSASFAASPYIRDNELSSFLEKKKETGYLVLPVLIRQFSIKDAKDLSALNFFKTYYSDYDFNDPATRNEIIPFDVLGDDEKTSNKKFQDYYYKLSEYIHTAVCNQFT
ncbi:MAG: TIR domain-containing protein [Chitinophagaceae bacterium]